MAIKDRFWDFYQIDENGCWNWTRSISSNGYGHFFFNGKVVTAHKTAWLLTNGEIPNGYCVCHRCDNRRCINPAHLFLGTKADNTRDAIQKGRFFNVPKTSKAHGENHGHTTLSSQQVTKIYRRYWNEKIKVTRLAKENGVCVQTICNIVHGRTWSHVTGAKS